MDKILEKIRKLLLDMMQDEQLIHYVLPIAYGFVKVQDVSTLDNIFSKPVAFVYFDDKTNRLILKASKTLLLNLSVDDTSQDSFKESMFIIFHEMMHLFLNHLGRLSVERIKQLYPTLIANKVINYVANLVSDAFINEYLISIGRDISQIKLPERTITAKQLEEFISPLAFNYGIEAILFGELYSFSEEHVVISILKALEKNKKYYNKVLNNVQVQHMDGVDVIKYKDFIFINSNKYNKVFDKISRDSILLFRNFNSISKNPNKLSVLLRNINYANQGKFNWKEYLQKHIKTITVKRSKKTWSEPLKQLYTYDIYFRGHKIKSYRQKHPILIIDSSASISEIEFNKFLSMILSGFSIFKNLYLLIHDTNPFRWSDILSKNLYNKRNLFVDDIIWLVNKKEYRNFLRNINNLSLPLGGTSHVNIFSNKNILNFINHKTTGVIILTDGLSDLGRVDFNKVNPPISIFLFNKNLINLNNNKNVKVIEIN